MSCQALPMLGLQPNTKWASLKKTHLEQMILFFVQKFLHHICQEHLWISAGENKNYQYLNILAGTALGKNA